MIIRSAAIITLFCLTACDDTQETEKKAIFAEKTILNDSITATNTAIVTEPVTFEDYLKDFSRRRKVLIQQLEKCTPQEANQLFLKYRKLNLLNAEKMTNISLKMLEDYGGLYSDFGGLNYSGKHKVEITQLLKSGLEPWYIGEGMTEIRVRPFEYDHLFSGRLTPDFEEFMQNYILDEQKLIVNDAALSISWEELASYIIRWENFIKKYPKSSLKKEAKETYTDYQLLFLLGIDNTPVIDYNTGKIYDENLLEFEKFTNYYNSAITSQLIEVLVNTPGEYEAKHTALLKKQTELLKKL